MKAPEKAIVVLGHTMTPETVREVIRQASAVHWGTHLLCWRYFDVTHEGMTSHRDALVPTALWHLLKRRDVDQAWPPGTTLEHLHDDARVTIAEPGTAISVYGYSRTAPPRLPWGFFHPATGIAVVYDAEADLITTVSTPEAGTRFLAAAGRRRAHGAREMGGMSVAALERLVHKYDGYVADLEGSGVEVLALLCVRDTIQAILHRLTPDAALPTALSARIDDLDVFLREERSTFLMVVGKEELRHARRGQGSPRAHWWCALMGLMSWRSMAPGMWRRRPCTARRVCTRSAVSGAIRCRMPLPPHWSPARVWWKTR